MRLLLAAAALLLAACFDPEPTGGPEICGPDIEPGCFIGGDEGDTCQSDDWCSYPLVCDDSAADFREWTCVAD